MLGVPMLTGGRVVGVIVLWRHEVDSVRRRDDRARHDVRRAGRDRDPERRSCSASSQERGAELARSVDELRALGEVSQAVSSSLDARRGAHDDRHPRRRAVGGRRRVDLRVRRRTRRVRAADLLRHERRARRGAARDPDRPRRDVHRPARRSAGEVRQAPDLDAEPPDPHLDALRRHGWRSMVAVPLRRERRRSSARSSSAGRRRARSPTRPSSCSRRSRASRPSRSTTPACSASSSTRRASSRSPAATSPSSWRACRTSCGRR